jgi:hypothetical protein
MSSLISFPAGVGLHDNISGYIACNLRQDSDIDQFGGDPVPFSGGEIKKNWTIPSPPSRHSPLKPQSPHPVPVQTPTSYNAKKPYWPKVKSQSPKSGGSRRKAEL